MLGRGAELVGRLLREPDDALVVAEVVVAQLGIAVEAEPAPDDVVEAPDEKVGEEVRRRLVLGAVDLVAMRAGELGVPREVGAAVGVRDDDVVAVRGLGDGGADLLGAVVQLGRDRSDLEIPAAPGGDLLDVEGKRAARDDDSTACDPAARPGRVTRSVLMPETTAGR